MNDLAGTQKQKLLEISERLMRLDSAKQHAFLKQLDAKGVNLSMLPIARQDRDRAPLSFAQTRLWFLWRMEPASAAYNMPVTVRVRGALDLQALQSAFDALVERHESLRTVFRQTDGAAEQIVMPPSPVALRHVTVTDGDTVAEATRIAREDTTAPFDLENGPLLRVMLIALGADDHVLVLTLHHIVSDGWSMSVLVDEFWKLYGALGSGGAPDLPELDIQYADYSVWQRLWIDAVVGERQTSYWSEKLKEPAVLQLPLDRPRPATPSHEAGTVRVVLDAALAEDVRSLARRHNTTLFVVLLAGLKLLLSRHSGQKDISVGVPFANRDRVETRRLIGLFVNTQVLRTLVDGGQSVSDFIASVHATTMEAQQNQDLPFERLLEILQPQRSVSQSPLFQVLYNHQRRQTADAAPADTGLRIEKFESAVETVKFDLALDTEETETGEIRALFSFASALFDKATIQRLGAHWVRLLESLARSGPARPVASLQMLSSEEQGAVRNWNAGASGSGSGFEPVHRMFADRVREAPDAPAVVFGDTTVTYGELDRRADRMARHLIGLGVGAGVLVGVSARRSPALIAAYLAVLKCGAAYLPLDPDHPEARRAAILRDSGARFLLTDVAVAEDRRPDVVVVVSFDEIERDEIRGEVTEAQIHEHSLAYVIYTSGSTGVPKGVEVAHGAFAMHCRATADLYDMDSRSRELHFLSFTFDGAHERMWTALTCGAALVLRDDDLWSAERTLRVLHEQRVSNAGFPPSYLQQVAEFASWQGNPPPVELYSFGGEAMPKAGFDLVKHALKPRTLINGYGPTETVVTPLVFKVGGEAEIASSYVPIGRPVGNRSAYVLDDDLNVVPVGVTGELYIGGLGLARGYRHRSALSAERFIPDPFGAPGSRLYRTGDLARWRADGNIEFIGRSDHQVKVRGFRIELGEIEAQLMRQPGVREAVVVARDAGAGRQLIGYAAGDDTLTDGGLRASLAEVLPDYMVPTRIVVLDRLPVTAHGKVDREAMPEPEMPGDREHVPPRTSAEIELAGIWADLLGVEAVSVHDNFFELGGDSVVSLQMVGRARQNGLHIEPRDVFRHQTLEELARAARTVADEPAEAADVPLPIGTAHPLLPIQVRFFSEEHGARHHWNQALLLTPRDWIDWSTFTRAIAAVVAHHDALRLRFECKDGAWTAEYGAAPDVADFVEIRSRVSAGAEITDIASAAQARLSLQGPLLRVVGMDLIDGSQRLLIAIHHLVIDAVSWRVLLEDVASVYDALQHGASGLPHLPKSQSYASWGARLADYAKSETLSAELPYWLERASGQRLPCDNDHDDIDRVDEGEEVALVIDAELTDRLLRSAHGAYRTQINDLLLAALGRAVWRSFGMDDVVIELEGHGREDMFPGVEVSRTVGWFTTAFPVRLPGGSQDDAALIKSVKEELRGIPARGVGFGVLRYLGTEAQRTALAAMAEPDIAFNYLGQFDGSVGDRLPFNMAAESAGATRSADAPLGRRLTINGRVRDAQLRLSFTYGRRRYRRQSIERLTEHYAKALREIVAHCTSGVRGLTPSDVKLSSLRQSDIDALGARLDWANVEDIYPLSPMQQGMLFHTLRDGDSGAYVNQVAVDVHGLDSARLAAAWQAVSDRHAILRTSFLWTDLPGPALQVVQRRVAVPFVVEDWRARAQSAAREELDALLAEAARAERDKGFDLATAPLQRVKAIRLDDDTHRLIWTHHHILLDGWSSARLIGEILKQERGERLPAVSGQYRDYIAWLLGRDHAVSAAFWQETLKALDEPTFLADAHSGAVDPKLSGHGSIGMAIEAGLAEDLQAFARRERVTLNTVVQGAWAQLLSEHCRQSAVCFGATVAGRPAELTGSGEMVGLFINTLPVVDSVSPESDVGTWLRDLQERNADARDHGWMPLYDIQRIAGRSGQALFDTILVFENYPIDEALRGSNDGQRSGRVEQVSITNYAMTVAVNPGANGLHLGFRYDRSRFDDTQVRHLQRSLRRILAGIVADGAGKVGNLAGLDGESCREVSRWSGEGAPGKAANFNGGIVARIEAQAASAPNALALLTDAGDVTYRALNARANSLARRIRAAGIGPDAVVGIAMNRGVEEIVAILAVLKAGAAYLPLDPDYPADRLAYMVRDSGTRLLLTETALRDPLAPVFQNADADVWTAGATGATFAEDDANPGVAVRPESLAYVMYTSGSTGLPKGVACTHGALASRLGWMQAEYGFDAGETLLHKTPFSFDVSVWEILLPLSVGARLAIAAPGSHREPKRLAEAVVAHDVTTLHFVPQMLEQFVAEPTVRNCVSLKRLFAGGEALPAELAARVRSVFPNVRFDNRYGPTETAINATFWPCDADVPVRVPIGRPIPGTIARILDGALNAVPPGVTGELFIGGDGLARGYWHRRVLTAERFIPDPSGEPGARLYRTGDLARWRADGQIEFVGRVDHQVKIRGFRIELAEIEARLLEQAGVQSAVVVAREAGRARQLVGYISGSPELDAGEIRERLTTALPDYMVPARIVVLERLPLTPSGKIDRNALPAPDSLHTGRAVRTAPRTDAEQALASIWAELLGEVEIYVEDNFFELGGDSIISLQMVSRARRHGLIIEPRDVFQHPVLEALARVARRDEQGQPRAEQGKVTGPHELLPIQRRFFEHDAGVRDHWNQAVLLQPRERIDWDAMRRAMSALVAHHDALRLRFEQRDGAWRAAYGEAAHDAVLLQVRDAEDGDEVTAIASVAQESLSLVDGDIVRAIGINVADGSQRLLLVIHHLAVDGVSWRVLREDLASAYEQARAGVTSVALPPKSHAYAVWGERLKAYAATPEAAAELPYWREREAAAELPCDTDADDADLVADASEAVLQLDAGFTARLLKDAQQAYRTQSADLLLAALARALWRWTGCADSVIELEGHGREDIFADLDVSRTIGWFTTAFPVRLPDGAADNATLIKSVKEELRAIPNRGIGYGVLRYLGDDAQRAALAGMRAPQIAFNYLGQIDGATTDASAAFALATESAGRSRSSSATLRHWISINALVRDGRLRVSFGFGRKRFRAETVDALAAHYKAALEEIADHCTGRAAGVTPSDFALSGLAQSELDRLGLDWRNVEDIYPLSPMQQGMLFHALHDDEDSLYVNQVSAEVRGIDAGRLRAAWQAVSDRHAALRTGFIWRELSGAPRQVVYRHVEVPFVEEDWRASTQALTPLQLEAALSDAAQRDREAGFDVSSPPLQRVRLIRLGEERYWLIWTHHHILMDGWSSARLLAEMMQHEEGISLPPVTHRYRDYIAWLQRQDRDASIAFWRDALADLDEPELLSPVKESSAGVEAQTGHGSVSLAVDASLTARVQQFAARERVTINTIVQAAWSAVLRRYGGRNRVAFGVTVAGRPPELQGSEDMIGLFINTLPVVDGPRPDQPVGDWLRDLQDRSVRMREHGSTPLYDIQRIAGRAGQPLFDSLLVFENYPVDRAMTRKDGRVRVNQTKIIETSNYPLFVSVGVDDGLQLVFNFQRRHFDDRQIGRLQGAFVRILEALSTDAERAVGALTTQDAEEVARVVSFNATASDAARLPLHVQFESRVCGSADGTALVVGDERLSYGALNARANALARRLRAAGVGPECVVALALERGVEMMVALLAVLKAGGAYLPLDPDYPAERLAHMLADSGAKLLLTQAGLRDRVAGLAGAADIWLCDDIGDAEEGGNLDVAVHPESLAYVIYTSGSTGLPKGVVVRHDAVSNFLATMAEEPGIKRDDRVLGLTSLSFDIAVLELFLPLTAGATVVLADREAARDPQRLKDIIAANDVTMIQATPATWRMLADHDGEAGLTWLKPGCRVLCGGEALPPDLAQRLVAAAGEVWNLYGPTETTVWSARRRLDAQDARPVLGGPIGNTTLYILDETLNVAPVGVAGELYIGGAGHARGYWQRGGLTAERFIPDPFGPPGARLYRTGDIARWGEDGALAYVGRSDHQVKIRGHRIEPGEIEAALGELAGVRSAVVVARTLGGGRQLVGYVTGDGDLDGHALRTELAEHLPGHMVPARVVVLDGLPLTPNGKVDRKALPDPDNAGVPAETYIAPRTATEAVLAAIWSELLQRPQVGVTDNFFELGGDSIVSLTMIGRARQAGLTITPRDVFRHQTIEAIAAVADQKPAAEKTRAARARGALVHLSEEQIVQLGLDRDEIEDFYPLSPMQQGMLFHALRDAGSGFYVNQVSVEIRGLDAARLKSAWREASARHSILRTGFLWRELSGSPLQVVYRDAAVPFVEEDWRGQTSDEDRLGEALAAERKAEFDLGKPPLQRVRLIRLEDDLHRLIWTYHHILMDGWSSARFISEALQLYHGKPLAEAGAHYGDYIAWLEAQDRGAAEQFWRGELARFEEPTLLAEAFGVRRHAQTGHRRCHTRLDETATEQLKAFARRERITLNTLIQGVWSLLLQRYSGQPTVTFGVTVSGRPASLEGAGEMLGLFINTLPVVEAPHPASGVGDWLRQLQDRNAAIRDYEHTPLYDIQGWAGRPGQTLFDSIIVFENYPIERSMAEGESTLSFSGLRNVDVTNYPMDLSVFADDVLRVEYTYMPSRFTDAEAEQIRQQFEHLLFALTRAGDEIVGNIDVATQDTAAVADRCNRHATHSAAYPLVHDAIAARAQNNPDRTALVLGKRSLTYGDLDARTNALANDLIARGVRPEDRVGVVVERTVETVTALLAVLKAGGAYVPIDPELPEDRLRYIQDDAGLSLILVQQNGARARDAFAQAETLDVSRVDSPARNAGAPTPPLTMPLRPENLAYIIYTSGSTGTPKGVEVAHGPLAMHCRETGAVYEMDDTSCELHFLSLAFDGAHERLLTVLSHGGRLVMRDGELWTPEQTVEALHAHRVSHIGLPPAYLQQVADWVEQAGNPPPVKLYSFGGEAMPKTGFDRVRKILAPRVLINGYGPTETVISPLVWKVGPDAACETPFAPIGLPVGDRRAYILDAWLNKVPAGVAGELYIGGSGLARGYHGKFGMSAERFVPDPFAAELGARMYRTGDLARWLDDGTVVYLGRSDDQVKVNGFRIELGEIQSALLRHEAVAQAAVVALPGPAGNRLVAYVAAPQAGDDGSGNADSELTERLIDHLRQTLPAYMVPSRIVVLDRLPLLSSGKVDRRALPEPDIEARAFVAPETPAEIAMARLWAELLKVPQVGVTDNFFELGGNSILSLKVVARLRQDPAFGIEIKLADLLKKPTIRALLGEVASEAQSTAAPPTALLPLNAPVENAHPVFCLHGGFGTVFDYGPLAQRLEGRRQVIGVQSRMLVAPTWQDSSLQEMAADYAREISRAYPGMPYTLVGWSLGGVLAALVASELERSGAKVAFLALVDSFVPRAGTDASGAGIPHWVDDLRSFLSATTTEDGAARIEASLQAARRDDLPETRDVARSLISQALEQGARRGGGGPMPAAEDLASAFMVGRHLQSLSRDASLPGGLAILPCCWWTADRLGPRDGLKLQIPGAIDAGVIDTDHFAILKDAAFLDAICKALVTEQPAASETPVHADEREYL